MKETNLNLRAGQTGKITFTELTGYTQEPELRGGVKVNGTCVDMQLQEDGRTLAIPPLPEGVWIYEVRADGATALWGRLRVMESPLATASGCVCWQGALDKDGQEVLCATLEIYTGQQGEPGPQGEQGPKGDKGEPGEKGEPGPAPTAEQMQAAAAEMLDTALYAPEPARHRTIEGTGNASLHWLLLDARRVPAGRLQAIGIPCRSSGMSGVGESAVWLTLEEQTEDGTGFTLLGSSVQPVQQAAGQTARWEFDGITLSGRALRICAAAEPGVWADDQWLGVRMAPREDGEESRARGNSTVNQVTDMTFEMFSPQFAAAADVEGHVADASVHVTADDRARWDAAAGGGTVSGDYAAASHVGDATHLQNGGQKLVVKGMDGGTKFTVQGLLTNAQVTGSALHVNVPDFTQRSTSVCLYSNSDTASYIPWFAAAIDATPLEAFGITKPGVHIGNTNYPVRIHGSDVYINDVPLFAEGGEVVEDGGLVSAHARERWDAAAADVEGHVADATVHVTADDRARWDGKAETALPTAKSTWHVRIGDADFKKVDDPMGVGVEVRAEDAGSFEAMCLRAPIPESRPRVICCAYQGARSVDEFYVYLPDTVKAGDVIWLWGVFIDIPWNGDVRIPTRYEGLLKVNIV